MLRNTGVGARRRGPAGLAAVAAVIVLAGCGGGSGGGGGGGGSAAASSGTGTSAAATGPRATTADFSTVVPSGWEQFTPQAGTVCTPPSIFCLIPTHSHGNGADGVIEAHKEHPVADSLLSADLRAAVKSLGGRQNIRYGSTTVGGVHAVYVDFYSPPGNYAAENFELVRVNHGGTTWSINLSERGDIPNAAKLLTGSFLPAFHKVLADWKWR